MTRILKRHPMALAVGAALALPAPPLLAQAFDSNSAAVRDAYVGPETQAKKDAALAGLQQLLQQLRTQPFCWGCSNYDASFERVSLNHSTNFPPMITAAISAANDGDLGTPGATVTLDSTRLSALASFSTARNFLITANGGAINTNGFNLALTGNLTANGTLVKEGPGTLVLTGHNVWHVEPLILSGEIEGNSDSLQTSLSLDHGVTVRFNQVADGRYPGVMAITYYGYRARAQFEKTGAGKLTLTASQSYGGATNLLNGTLALQGAGSLGNTRGVNVAAGAVLDISGAATADQNVGALSGSGSVVLGTNRAIIDSGYDSTFSGRISGAGSVLKMGYQTLTLTSPQDYAGGTTIAEGWLALSGQGRLSASGALNLVGGSFDIANSPFNHTVGSISGSSDIYLGDNSLTLGGDNSNQSYRGNIFGSGGITKVGTGTWAVDGNAYYTGATTIEQGNLIAKTYSISERVINNATLTLVEEARGPGHPFFSAYSGNIAGSGRLVKDGEGLIWLRGRNTYTGGTEVKAGILIGNTDSLQGNVVNDSALAFYQVNDGQYGGTLSGSGTLLQYGPGILSLTGNNTHTGGTASSGTLRVTRDENLGAANGALALVGGTLQIDADLTSGRNIVLAGAGGTFDTHGKHLTLNGEIVRAATDSALRKNGAGTLTLNGEASAATVAIDAGRLEINGRLLGDTVVATGAELGGTGTLQGSVINRGRLALGSGLGTLTVMGDLTFENGSLFTVKTDAEGRSDRLQVRNPPSVPQPAAAGASPTAASLVPGPRVILNGGTVDVRAEDGNYRRNTRYNIINADSTGGVVGQFANASTNLAFLTPSLSYDPHNVYLTLTRNGISYTAVSQNANQLSVVQSLNRMADNGTGDALTVTNLLDGLSAPQARAAFDSIAGAGRAVQPLSLNVNQRAVNQLLVARLGLADSGHALAPDTGIAGRALMLAYEETVRSDALPIYAQLALPSDTEIGANNAGARNGLWLRGYGGSGRIDGDANASGAKYHFGGAVLGYDHKFGDTTAGVFAAYGEPRYDQDFSASSAKSKTVQAGIYGRYVSDAWHIDGVASYARQKADTSRWVTAGGLNRLATGSFDGDAWSAQVETGYTIKQAGFDVQPLAAISWLRQTQNAYSETGAGALNLILPKQSQNSLRSSLGARTVVPFDLGGAPAVFEARAAWSHEFKDTRSIDARLAGDPAAGVFTLSGPHVPRNSAVLGMGIATQATRGLRLYADVNSELNGGSRAYALSAGLRYQW